MSRPKHIWRWLVLAGLVLLAVAYLTRVAWHY